METKYNLGDLSIVPSKVSQIDSRKDCNALYYNKQSPFIVAPMDTVIDEQNFEYFIDSGVNVCLPRGVKYPVEYNNTTPNLLFESFSLNEFINIYCNPKNSKVITNFNVLIDIANGHMAKLFDACITAKEIWGDNLILMVGNVANPETVDVLANIGVEYIRCGIGGGGVCTTTSHTAVHYPMASLIMECSKIADSYGGKTKIIADGGIKSTADINIALACGADYIMMGGLFNQCIESCADTYWKGIKLPKIASLYMYNWGFNLFKNYRGMSTVEVQKKWGASSLKLSEGIKKRNPVKYELNQLIEDITHRLKTAMSYTDCLTLEEYNSGKVELIVKTPDTNNRVNKI